MKIAASMSVGRLAPKHSLNIDGLRAISKNVTPKLIKNDVILIDRLRSQDGKHLTIEEYTDQHFQPYIDQYNAKQRRKDRQIQVGYCEWHRGNGTLSQGKGELAYEAVAYPSCYKFTTAIVTQVIATDITYCKSILHSGFANKHILSHLQIPVYRCVHVTTHHPENQWSVILMFYITFENKSNIVDSTEHLVASGADEGSAFPSFSGFPAFPPVRMEVFFVKHRAKKAGGTGTVTQLCLSKNQRIHRYSQQFLGADSGQAAQIPLN